MNATQIGELMRILDRIDKRLEIIAEQLTREKLTAATDTWAYSIPINSKPTYEKVFGGSSSSFAYTEPLHA